MRVSFLLLFVLWGSSDCRALCAEQESDSSLSILSWNIWHGGKEDGKEVGPQRVAEVIRGSGADLIAMQETYGSGELLSAELGFHFLPRGTNVSIHSRFPIVADVSVFEPFKCVGAIVELPDGEHLAFYSIWLPYDGEIWAQGTREGKSVDELLAACASSALNLASILESIGPRLEEAGFPGIPVVVAGDFNSMSHFDYTEAARAQYGHVIDWPTSRVAENAGFRDTYRDLHPEVNRNRDSTWTPRFPEQQQDRIDFIYDLGTNLQVVEARVIDEFTPQFPSDHGALLVRLERSAQLEVTFDEDLASYKSAHDAWKEALDTTEDRKEKRTLKKAHPAAQYEARMRAHFSAGDLRAAEWSLGNLRDLDLKRSERDLLQIELYDALLGAEDAELRRRSLERMMKDSAFARAVTLRGLEERVLRLVGIEGDALESGHALFLMAKKFTSSRDAEEVERGLGMMDALLEVSPPESDAEPQNPNHPTLGEGDRKEAEGIVFALRFLAIGKVAPDFTGSSVDGEEISLKDTRGKVTVLSFFGFW
jgi:endonuclease/exonuclease/phosphatase family metal-dependent hydrolase